ncbi:MAG: DNA polymerase III subunit beta [Candidatus Taylorbacteria bacterium RIFCSPHIGHO2_02_FULL_47_18]|uniref:Beta sliding clamp n=1 Tax=Candidatus Taylorbacteria bacterium RIFCSPLOWO2_01_FULL_48_100 TaxID=1802322 RepID=A0A1G2NEW1_9BACT|nr:MAG: DNA polymerase III subunit beta [Candidatus Taylorbacteria bacterium RIFCSPHIGHO2_01_FULL_48_38]OHA28231.1 MAG: DNA polymerase III subunit beta [Candidatus Taylorbacteria bacterium RIFCSPHIGHO2_02_FULL_47_18]OHA33882.1 MAG: DNA polymerase III subunit beta [Candidatus Taylorbacteria bacterium RIFCSPLOWO2_01_FULL_48_100]OHA40857.1 MAG: DNA polymerase III subunit beta [Candidatus Taylorbacteria bacterium RIFCSPLOWO2_02_FULL_48_16]OHA45131.1 MAG: DNA polymerase III subunit beta [Candidatus 
MKGECFKEKLEQAVRNASRVTGKNPSLPVLACVLIEAKKGSVVVRATNIDVAYEVAVPARIEKEGVIAVSGIALNTFLSGVSAQNVLFHSTQGGLSVSGGNASAVLKVFPHEDFPKFSQPKESQNTIPTYLLASGLKSVLYSASQSSIRQELSSIYIFSEGNSVVFAATDSFRLAEKHVFPQKNISIHPTLLPAKNAAELLRIVSEIENESCTVASESGQFVMKSDGMVFTSRVIDGSFPDYKQIIPKEFTTTVTLLKDDLAKALQLASGLSEKSNQILITVPASGDEISLSVKNAEVGEGVSTLKSSRSGEAIEMSFNARYLIDVLGAITESSMSLMFSGVGKPLLITGAGSSGFRYIVMPMNR